MVYLPAYAPELNPTEGVWAWVKGWLANRTWRSVAELVSDAQHALTQVRRVPDLAWSLLRRTGLPFTA